MMKRVCVLGCPGSGKSTFSEKLAAVTGLPLFHLDMIWWKSDKTHVSRDEFDEKLSGILPLERFIIDGDYSRTYKVRLTAADTVFFFDCTENECIDGITSRLGIARTDIPFTDITLDPELLDEVKNYRAEKRPKVLKLLSECEKCGKNVIIFKNRSDADLYIEKIAEKTDERR